MRRWASDLRTILGCPRSSSSLDLLGDEFKKMLVDSALCSTVDTPTCVNLWSVCTDDYGHPLHVSLVSGSHFSVSVSLEEHKISGLLGR